MMRRGKNGLTLLMNKERGRSYRRPLLCQPFRAVKNVAGLHGGHLRGVHAFPLFRWADMPLDVLLHTGNCPALDSPPAWGGARSPRGGLPPTEARGVIRPDPHTAHLLCELSHHSLPSAHQGNWLLRGWAPENRKPATAQGLLSQRGFSAGKSALLTLKLYTNVRNFSENCVQGYLWGPSPTQKRAVQYFSL